MSGVRGLLTSRRVGLVVVVLAVLGIAVGGLVQFRIDTEISSFLPHDDPAVTAIDDKAKTFGGDAVVVLIEAPAAESVVTDPGRLKRLLRLEGQLSQLDDVATVYGPATVLNQTAITARGVLARIAGREDALRFTAERAARAQGAGAAAVRAAGDLAVKNFRLRYGTLLVEALPAGLPTLSNSRFVDAVVFDDDRPRPQWRFLVPNRHAAAVLVRPTHGTGVQGEQQLMRSIQRTVRDAGLDPERVTYTGVPAVTAELADEIGRELPLLSSLTLLVLLVRFWFVPGAVRRRDRLVPLGAALAGALLTLAAFGWVGASMSLGSVVLLPLLLSIGSSFPLYLRLVSNPSRVLAAAAASALAFGSLALSPLPFVRQLGVALALGVALTVLIAMALPQPRLTLVQEPTGPRSPSRPAAPSSRRRVVAAVGAAVAVAGLATLPTATVAADPRDLAAGLDSIRGAERVERIMGSSAEVSLVLTGPDVMSADALAWQRAAQNRLIAGYGDLLRPVLTTPDLFAFLGDDPTPSQVAAALDLLPKYLSRAVVSPGRDTSVLTFGLRLQELEDQTELLDRARRSLPALPSGYHAELVGLPVAAARGYDLISSDRYLPNLAGIAAAGFVLLIGLRPRSDATRAVAASLLATGWSLGILMILGLPLTPLSVALGSLTTVTASEFTVILSHSMRRGHQAAARTVGWACLTSAIGYLVLLASSLDALRDFGLILAASVLLSYLAARTVMWVSPVALDPPSDGQPEEKVEVPV